MNQDQPELTFDESVAQVMQTLPPPIRNYLARGGYSVVAKNLMFKYQLRVDQGGVLEREIMLLIMGIENPDEFTQALVEEAKLDQKNVDSIVQDVNDQIFVPLQEEMRKGETSAPEPAKPTAPQMPPRHVINKISMLPATPRPMVSDSKLLEDHEEPHIEFVQAPITPPAARPASISSSPRPITPPPTSSRPTMPPPNLPGAPRPSGNLGGGGVGIPPVPLKPYPSDPYREPIDGKE